MKKIRKNELSSKDLLSNLNMLNILYKKGKKKILCICRINILIPIFEELYKKYLMKMK